MLTVLDILQRDFQAQKSCADCYWSTLCHMVVPTSSYGGQGFPFLGWYGDFDECNHNNWISSSGELELVPLFIVTARLDCNYTIPLRPSPRGTFCSHSTASAILGTKRPPVLWRGGMTDVIHNVTIKCPLWLLVQAARALDVQRPTPRFDMAINDVPPRARPFNSSDRSTNGEMYKKEDTMDFLDLQPGVVALVLCSASTWSYSTGTDLCRLLLLSLQQSPLEDQRYGTFVASMEALYSHSSGLFKFERAHVMGAGILE